MGHWGLYLAASLAVRPVVVMAIMAEAYIIKEHRTKVDDEIRGIAQNLVDPTGNILP